MITGSGMLATALARRAEQRDIPYRAFPHSVLDVADRQAVNEAVFALRPDLIFHTAALTRVNYCEEFPQQAHATNAQGTAYICEAAEKVMARLVYFSTDYVFDGAKNQPYLESDVPGPLNAYGASKLAGEQPVLESYRGHVVRTSGVFGARGDGVPERNFWRALAAAFCQQHGEIALVDDQITALTAAEHLASILFILLQEGLPKTVHLVSAGAHSWYGWMKAVAAELMLDSARLKPVHSADYASGVNRPRFSVLGSEHRSVATLISMHPALPAAVQYMRRAISEALAAPPAFNS
jgi:dTDP-4-dehydrorhamnose reductase